MNFWEELPRPFLALAPMEDVTDVVFRRVIMRAGRPDVFFTEFTNTASFCSEKGEISTRGRLTFTAEENPIVAQIWGDKPANFATTAGQLRQRGFVGIDINMGCPDKKVVKSGGGSALIKTPDLAIEIIRATREGWLSSGQSEETSHNLSAKAAPSVTAPIPPVSVKTRLGYAKIEEWRPWLTTLLEQNLANLTVHLRTKKEMSKVPAHFELIPDIVRLRDQIAPTTKLTINGDIRDRAHALELWQKNPSVDGFMIGRGVFANPFCFTDITPTQEQLFDLLNYHLDQFDKWRNIGQPCHSEPAEESLRSFDYAQDDAVLQRKFDPLKRFFKIYIKDFPGAAELRAKLFDCRTTDEVRKILKITH